MSKWTEAEISALKEAYASPSGPVDLVTIALAVGRDKHNVCRKARELGLTNQNRRKVEARKPTRKYSTIEEARAAVGRATRLRLLTRGHPRGAQGMKHSPESKGKISLRSKAAWANVNSGHHSEKRKQAASDTMMRRIAEGKMRSGYSRSRGGRRADLGDQYFRSAWEANYARYLNFLASRGEIEGWLYEPKTFVFEKIQRGSRAYTPDFKILLPGGGHEWHEVKGWMDQPSKTRIARMRKYFPEERLIIVDSAWFKSANKTLAPFISGWETGTVHV